MKVITLIKSFSALGVTAVGITAAVAFTDTNNVPSPYVRVLTKDNYLKIRTAQNDKNVNINYGTLPTSSRTVIDLLTSTEPTNKAFMFTLGSQAYATTNQLLNGINKDFDNGGNPDVIKPQNSLMLTLYDRFYMGADAKLSAIDMSFYSYIDIVATKEYQAANDLLTHRRTVEGDLPPDENNVNDNTKSRQWNVLNDKGNTEPTNPNKQPVVKDGAKFNYYPVVENGYEYRKDNKHDTAYEKVFFRNDAKTKQYVDVHNWMSTYSSAHLKGASFSESGSLLCAKYDSVAKQWKFQSFIAASDFENITAIDGTLNEIITFYTTD